MNGHTREHNASGVLLELPMRSHARTRARVVIAESRRLHAEALMFALDSSHRCDAIGYALTGADAIELVAEYEPDVIVIGGGFPELDSADLALLAHELCPRSRLVLVGDHRTDDELDELAVRGIVASVPESGSAAQLLEAIDGGSAELLPEYGDA
jgi:DNA-binding NarL/FixJ family response regulator